MSGRATFPAFLFRIFRTVISGKAGGLASRRNTESSQTCQSCARIALNSEPYRSTLTNSHGVMWMHLCDCLSESRWPFFCSLPTVYGPGTRGCTRRDTSGEEFNNAARARRMVVASPLGPGSEWPQEKTNKSQ